MDVSPVRAFMQVSVDGPVMRRYIGSVDGYM